MCVPSKLTTYFAAKRPVVAVSDPGSAASHEMRASGAGVLVNSGGATALVEAFDKLRSCDLDSLGEAGLAYARSELSESSAIGRYLSFVSSLLANRCTTTLASLVPNIALGGTSFRTTVFGSTIALRPMVTPPNTIALEVTHVPASIVIGRVIRAMSSRKAWVPVVIKLL